MTQIHLVDPKKVEDQSHLAQLVWSCLEQQANFDMDAAGVPAYSIAHKTPWRTMKPGSWLTAASGMMVTLFLIKIRL